MEQVDFNSFTKNKQFLNRPVKGSKPFYISDQRFTLFTELSDALSFVSLFHKNKIISIKKEDGSFTLYEKELENSFGYLVYTGEFCNSFCKIDEV